MDVKRSIKDVGRGILGILLLIGFCVIPLIFIFGILKVSEIAYPIVSALAGFSIIIFLLIVLPLSLFKKFRSFLAGFSVILSFVIEISVFMFSFLTIFYFLGWIAIFFMISFQLVSPIATLGLFFKREWAAGFSIILGLIFTYGIRF